MLKIFCSLACSLIITFCIIYGLFARQKMLAVGFREHNRDDSGRGCHQEIQYAFLTQPQIRRWFKSVRISTKTKLNA